MTPTVANRSAYGKNSLNREVLLGESAHRSAGWQIGFGLVDDSANAVLKQSLAPSGLHSQSLDMPRTLLSE
jgi:hypothetical protein